VNPKFLFIDYFINNIIRYKIGCADNQTPIALYLQCNGTSIQL
jgi:hypothetical protein